MESMLKSICVRLKVLFTICAIISTSSLLSGQTMPQINARFSNPHFDDNTRMYFLDVELNSKVSKEFLFGMNVRFFYDANMLEFQNFDQFTAGYGTLGETPRSTVSNGQAGVQMFNLKESTVFVNGAVQLTDENNPLQIVPEKWVKVFRVCFKVPLIYSDKRDFCPSVIWDAKGDMGRGGFLMGDDGLVITVLENDPTTPEVSAPSHVTGTFFNWEQNAVDGMPYGKPIPNNCVTISQTTSTQDNDVNAKGFALFQNDPNPFNRGTAIQFILPTAQHATFKFYDATGKQLDEINGEYKEGRNILNLDRQPWMVESKVVFYRMETEGFRSNTLKMVLINE
jgi:hypothetical protein